jgi:hypothetical protein
MTTREQKLDHLRDLRKHDDEDLPTELDLVYDDLKRAQARIEQLEAALRDVEDALGYVKNEGKSPAVRESNAHIAWKIARAALAPEQDK